MNWGDDGSAYGCKLQSRRGDDDVGRLGRDGLRVWRPIRMASDRHSRYARWPDPPGGQVVFGDYRRERHLLLWLEKTFGVVHKERNVGRDPFFGHDDLHAGDVSEMYCTIELGSIHEL